MVERVGVSERGAAAIRALNEAADQYDTARTSSHFAEKIKAAKRAEIEERREKISSLTQRLKRIIEPNFERREQYLHDKNQINDEIAAFATDLSTLMYNAEEVPETTLDILGNLKKAMPSFIQEIETTLDSNTPKQEIEDLKFILENLDLLEALPQMFFDIYESVNQEALSVLLGNELIQSYPRCCKIDNNVDINGKLLGVSAEIVREWVRHLEASSFIIDGFVLSLPIGSDSFLKITQSSLEKIFTENNPSLLCDYLRKHQLFTNYAQNYMDIWYKLTFLPSLIHELSQSLSSIFTEASKFSLKDWKKRHVYLLEIGLSLNLRMYQNFVTFLFNAEKKRKKTVLTTQAESLRNLIEDLSEILRNPLRTIESTFQDRLLSALLEDAIDKESSDKAQNASNFVCSFFSNIFEQYQLESGDPLPWGAFLKTLDSYKQNVETPLESTQLLELGWRLPEELAEGAPTYNNGWRAYDKNTTPVSNSRIIALSSLHIPPGSTIAYALRLDYRQTELLKRVLDVFGEELE